MKVSLARQARRPDPKSGTRPVPRLPEPLPIHTATMDNGATVLVCDLPHLHRVSLSMAFNVGSRDETDDVHGVSHLLEHLMFRGTAEHPSLRAVGQAFEELGGNFNAFTARESTSYETLLPPESLTAGVRLLAAVVSAPRLTGIAAERDIILEEILGDYSDDGRLVNADDLLMEELYLPGGLGRTIAGSPDTVGRLSQIAVRDHYRRFYRGPGTVVSVVGPVGSVSGVLDLVANALATLPSGEAPALDATTRAPTPRPRIRFERNEGSGQTDLAFGADAIHASHDDFPALEIAMRLLDDGLSSRLPRRLIDELGLVYDVEAYAMPFRERSACQVRATARHRRVARVADEILGVLEALASVPVPAEELQRTQMRVLWEHQALLDRPDALAQWLVAAARRGEVADPRSRCERLLQVTSEQVRSATASTFFAQGQRLVLVGELGPKALERLESVVAGRLACDLDVVG